MECKFVSVKLLILFVGQLLIEPEWNVNLKKNNPRSKQLLAFNRTRMECK